MKNLLPILVFALAALAGPVHAASDTAASSPAGKESTCDAQAAEKKLSGAAKTSFVKKCEKDAKADASAACESQAAAKKLYGAAKNSFVKKCVADAGK